eukprot:2088984-Pyramimonas_sp.AAC.1
MLLASPSQFRRLHRAGAEDRLPQTGCGFRRRRGADDIRAVRRHIELARARTNVGNACVAFALKESRWFY